MLWHHTLAYSQTNELFIFLVLRSVIPLIDKNGDGKISAQELSAWTHRSMRAFYRQEADSRLRTLDSNKDGKISWEEYAKGAENRAGKPPCPHPPPPPPPRNIVISPISPTSRPFRTFVSRPILSRLPF